MAGIPLATSESTSASRRTSFGTSSHPLSRPGTGAGPSPIPSLGHSGGSSSLGQHSSSTLPYSAGSSSLTLGSTSSLVRANTGGTSSPIPVSGLGHGNTPITISTGGGAPTNDDIEAVIQMATSASRPSTNPPRDTRTQLFVGNLPYRVRWQDLKDLFRRAGTVLRADVSLGPDNRSRGYGTVLLATAEDAGRAVDMFNGYEWMTRVLEVRPDRMGATPALDESQFGMGGGGTSNLSAGMLPSGGLVPPTSVVPPPVSLPRFPNATASSGLGGSGGGSGSASPFLSALSTSSAYLEDDPSVASRSLFVGNLPFHIQWQDLKDLFRMSGGTILRADVALGADGRSRGFGMVSFATEGDAERARGMFNGYEYHGRALKVHFDKFAATSSSSASATGTPSLSSSGPALPSPISLSASTTPQSPTFASSLHPHLQQQTRSSSHPHPHSLQNQQSHSHHHAHSHPTLSHVASFAQQIYLSQYEQHPSSQQLLSQTRGGSVGGSGESFRQHTGNGAGGGSSIRQPQQQQTFRYQLALDDTLKSPILSPSYAYSQATEQHLQQRYSASSPSSSQQQDFTGSRLGSSSRIAYRSPGYPSSFAYEDTLGERSPFEFSGFGVGGGAGLGASGGFDVGSASNSTGRTSSAFGTGSSALRGGMSLEEEVMQPGSTLDLGMGRWASMDVSSLVAESGGDKEKGTERDGEMKRPSTSGATTELSKPDSTNPGSRPQTQPVSPTSSQSPPHSQTSHVQGSSQTLLSQPPFSEFQNPISPTLSQRSQHLQQHPAHPGPISLPPPPPVTAFPIPPPHTLSPYHSMSPYVSPLYHPAVAMSMGMGVGMTPHGLPPITPSMPSFTFLPQPSPHPHGIPSNAYASSSSAAVAALGGDILGPGAGLHRREDSLGGGGGEGSNDSRSQDTFTAYHTQSPSLPQQQYQQQQQQQQQPPSATQATFMNSAHAHILSPYSPFSPGVTMSPGAFWGRPGSGANPYINPAVGAPVHQAQSGGYYTMRNNGGEETGYFPPLPPSMSHLAQHQQQPRRASMEVPEEPQSYFPFVPPLSSATSTSRPSGLSQEIRAGEIETGTLGGGAPNNEPSVQGGVRAGSSASAGTTTGTGTRGSGSATSPRPTSSRGTSWHTDSVNVSPQPRQDVHVLAKGLESIALAENEVPLTGVDDTGKPQRAHSSGDQASKPQYSAGLARADSDPVKSSSGGGGGSNGATVATDRPPREGLSSGKKKPDLGIDVARSNSESWSRVL